MIPLHPPIAGVPKYLKKGSQHLLQALGRKGRASFSATLGWIRRRKKGEMVMISLGIVRSSGSVGGSVRSGGSASAYRLPSVFSVEGT